MEAIFSTLRVKKPPSKLSLYRNGPFPNFVYQVHAGLYTRLWYSKGCVGHGKADG